MENNLVGFNELRIPIQLSALWPIVKQIARHFKGVPLTQEKIDRDEMNAFVVLSSDIKYDPGHKCLRLYLVNSFVFFMFCV